jgi:hypothetical protein
MADYDYGQLIDDFELGVDVMPDEDLTAYIERRRREFESKADGGSIGIEVLFTDKMKDGGRVPMVSGGALKAIGSGIMKMFSKGDDVVDLAKQEEIFRSGDITTEFLENVDDKVIKKFISTRDAKGVGGYGLYDNFDDMPNGLKAAELISRIKNAEGGINYEAAELFIGKKLKGNETVNELIKMVITEKKADGGRVGLFMGGPALEGQALSIYNSMKGYGATDQAIADRLGSMGLYDPNASTPDPTPDPGQSQSQGQSGGRGSGQDVGYVGRQDYNFNKKNYGPGQQLEINPAAFGMSFPDQPSGPKKEGIINQAIDSFTSLPTRSLSSFASPTTGGNIVGPAEQGFMGQTLDIDPAGRTREEIRSLYDNYNRFLGRTSNFADARQKGKAGQVLGTLVGAAAGIPFVGSGIEMFTNAFGPRGDKSLRSKYTVDNVGFGNTGARDEFGLATFDKKDGFLGLTGNTTRDYTDRMNERLGELTDFFGSRIEGFDINNLDAETLDKMKDINGFYTKQIQAYKQRLAVEDINKRTQDAIEAEKQRQEAKRIQDELAAAAAAKSKAAALAAIKKQGQADYNPNIHGPTNYGRDSQGNQSFDFGGGFGIGSDGGPVSNRTGRGRTGYSEGGLATMFTRRR